MNENGQRGLSLIVAGPDQDVVIETAAKLEREMATIPTLRAYLEARSTGPRSNQAEPALAAELGVSTDVMAETVRVGTIGDIGASLPKFDAATGRCRSACNCRRTCAATATSSRCSRSRRRTARPCRSRRSPTSNSARDRRRRPLRPCAPGRARRGYARNGRARLDHGGDRALPTAQSAAGVELKETGDAEVMVEVFTSFGQAMGAGIMMVLGVLILLFANFLQPFTILLSLPLSIGGAILGLVLTQNAISLPVVIGFLMLMGS